MKRYFLNHATNEEATVSQETDAVTVTRRDVGSRSKGKPTRIPIKRCQGGSIGQEARVQELKLQAAGFEFDRDDGEASSSQEAPFIYVRVTADKAAEVVEWMTGCNLPEGVVVQPVSRDVTVLRDARNGEIRANIKKTEETVVTSHSPLAAVAYLLGDRGLATIYSELPSTPNRTELLTPMVRTALIRNLSQAVEAYLDEAGLSAPGIVKTTSITPAVML